jgi:hypothetical protein
LEWWKAGEEGAERVYSRGWRVCVSLLTAAFAFLCYVLFRNIKGNYSDQSFLLLCYLVSAGLILFQARRAIIISDKALISRPCLGELTIIPFAWISQVSVADPSPISVFIGYPEERLRVQLTSGTVIYIYLDVGRKKRILADLKGRVPTAFLRAR